MRLVILSDTHSFHTLVDVPDGDVLIHCGDICGRSSLDEITRFDAWLGTLPHKRKLVVAGNHDIPVEATADPQALFKNALYLQDAGIDIDGVRFWGSPWQPEFCDWSFNLPRGPELAAKWALIPSETHVLITHGPPHGILDLCPDTNNRSKLVHVGCEDMLHALQRVRPRVHCFGHIHEGYGRLFKGGTLFVNASICTGTYKPSNLVQVVDL